MSHGMLKICMERRAYNKFDLNGSKTKRNVTVKVAFVWEMIKWDVCFCCSIDWRVRFIGSKKALRKMMLPKWLKEIVENESSGLKPFPAFVLNGSFEWKHSLKSSKDILGRKSLEPLKFWNETIYLNKSTELNRNSLTKTKKHFCFNKKIIWCSLSAKEYYNFRPNDYSIFKIRIPETTKLTKKPSFLQENDFSNHESQFLPRRKNF